MTIAMDQRYHVLDTETASLTGGVAEIAWLVIDKDLNIHDQQCHRVNPGRPIEPGAQEIHGISDADVAHCPPLSEIAKLLPENITVIGHNCSFDVRMIKGDISVGDSLCTLSLSRQFIKGTLNHKLPTLKQALGLSEQASHTALGDCLTVLDLLKVILPLSGRSLDQLISVANKPKIIHRITFGKHKGQLINTLPPSYRRWFLEQKDIDKDLRYTLEMLERVK